MRFFRFVNNLFVGTSLMALLLIATAAALYLAPDIPGMFAAGIPDRDIPATSQRASASPAGRRCFAGSASSPRWVPMMMAAGVLIISRRGTYGMHMLRGVAGVLMFGLAMVLLVQSTHRSSWLPASTARATITNRLSIDSRGDVVAHGDGSELEVDALRTADRRHQHDDDGERVAAAIEHYLHDVNGGFLVASTGAALLALLLMCWPARREGTGRPGNADANAAAIAPAPAATEA